MYIVLLGNWFYLSAAESVRKYMLLVVNVISLKRPTNKMNEYSLHLGHCSISNDTVDFNSPCFSGHSSIPRK